MEPYPLQFEPILKPRIWGGRRLGEQLRKPIGGGADWGECWELVDHGEDQSVVAEGQLAGQALAQVFAEQRQWLMGPVSGADQWESFPLLLKYLDCNQVLSVQVHPDDRYAASLHPPDQGKTEAWYIVAADEGATVYAGLKPGVDRQLLRDAIQAGEVDGVLHSLQPRPGDVIFVPAGTVHALGGGLLVAEIQQSSDTTFRLFDWNRVGPDGMPRQLHLQHALEVADYGAGPVIPRRAEATVSGWQRLVTCDQFELSVLTSGSASLAGDQQFHILTVPHGLAELRYPGGVQELSAGASRLLPAALGQCQLSVAADTVVMAVCLPH